MHQNDGPFVCAGIPVFTHFTKVVEKNMDVKIIATGLYSFCACFPANTILLGEIVVNVKEA